MSDEQNPHDIPIVWNGKLLVAGPDTQQPLGVRPGERLERPELVPVFAGSENIVAFIVDAPDETTATAAVATLGQGAVFSEIMYDLGRFDRTARSGIVRALAIERWSNRYRFCPACGYALEWSRDSIAKICLNAQRVHRHFPRLDPAIIVLVVDGDRVLLGRAARWPPGWFSTLAGFVEPGETLEAAIRREIFEEAGIVVGTTRYFGSESWPFPRSLMLGYFAQAQTATISLNDGELEEARWFEAAELRALLERMSAARPYFDTIARRLMAAWLAEVTP